MPADCIQQKMNCYPELARLLLRIYIFICKYYFRFNNKLDIVYVIFNSLTQLPKRQSTRDGQEIVLSESLSEDLTCLQISSKQFQIKQVQ